MGWLLSFYKSSVGKKAVVAGTGLILVLFLLGHMLGNLQTFEGAHKLNAYAKLLRIEPGLLLAIRVVLLATAVLHLVTTVLLYFQNRRARAGRYAVQKTQAATWSSRTMIWGGILLAGFIVYHLLHLTTGHAHHALFERHGHADVYARVVESFRNPWITGAYVIAMIVLFFHLRHGIRSLVETLGVTHPRLLTCFQKGGPILALLLVLGFLAVPVGVFLGWAG